MSAVYAALLRMGAGEMSEEPRQYRNALDVIRALSMSGHLSDAELGAEVRSVFAALKRVQEDLDR